jgi:ribosomal-protein-alanine N-acetyltransferase
MKKLPFTEYPKLETERLVLRKIDEEKDLLDFFTIRSNPETMRHIPRPVAKDPSEVLSLIKEGNDAYERGDMLSLAMALKDSNKFIGVVGFYRIDWDNHRTEIGYILNQEYSGKGYMHEACTALIQFAFEEVGFHSLEAIIEADNLNSMKVIEKLGFTREAYFKEKGFSKNKYIDLTVYSLINPKDR